MICFKTWTLILIILIIFILFWILLNLLNKTKINNDESKKINILNELNSKLWILWKQNEIDNNHKWKNLISNNDIIERDIKVQNDPLYPPILRTLPNEILRNTINWNLFNNININDSYRMIGYLTGKNNNKILILMGREKYRNKYDFYAIPANKDLTSIKIPIDNIRDMYQIPQEIQINDIFPDTYIFTEIKKDFDSNYF